MAFGFYQGARGLYEPSENRLLGSPVVHNTAEFAPISRYEGKGESPRSFNTGTTYQCGTSIDERLTGNYRTAASSPQQPQYFSTTNFMQYIQ